MEAAGWQPVVGARVGGKYVLEAPLGAGGMGAVFRARHEVTLHPVAIKFLLDGAGASTELVQRFLREASAANRIGHPAFVKVLDLGEEHGRPYLIMELLAGRTLGGLVRGEGPRPVAEACRMARRFAEALGVAHAAGIVHRDLKPENLFVTSDGELKILDLGIAKFVSETQDGLRTQTHAMIGSPHTMSPEQCRGARIDHRSDIYSLAVVIYYLLSGGHYPITGELPGDIVARQIFGEPRPLAEVAPWLPADLCAAVHVALQKNPDDRPQTMADLVTRLEPFEHSQVTPPAGHTLTGSAAASAIPRTADQVRSASLVGEATGGPPPRRAGLFVAGALLLCGASFGGAWWLRGPTSAPSAVAAPSPSPPPSQSPNPSPSPNPSAAPTPTPTTAPAATPVAAPATAPDPAAAPSTAATPATAPAGAPATAPAGAPATATARKQFGTLQVFVLPFAQVFVDGKFINETPIYDHRLPAGPHTVVLKNLGIGRTERRAIQIEPGRTVTLRAKWPRE